VGPDVHLEILRDASNRAFDGALFLQCLVQLILQLLQASFQRHPDGQWFVRRRLRHGNGSQSIQR
jgi:hypothetical protein